jgi:putative peptide zinc metalloprotease protein
MAVSAAGMYVELLIASAATVLWWATDSASLLHHLAFSLMLVCSINTIVFNANPLMRFDGYFIFSDWVKIPNLAELGSRLLRNRLLFWFGFPVSAESSIPVRQRRLVLVYGVLSFIYRTVVLAGALYVISIFLSGVKLGALGFLLLAGAMFVYLGWPALCLCRSLILQRVYRHMRYARLAFSVVLLSAFGAVVALVPLPRHIETIALVQPDPVYQSRVSVPDSGGYLGRLVARDGQTVEEGDVLAILDNPQVEIALQLNEADQALRLQQQRELISLVAETTADRAAADWQLADYELQSLQRQHSALQRQQDMLVLRAPRAGTVVGLPPRDLVGKWWDKGAELCRISNDQALRAVFLVEPADQPHLRTGNAARLLIHGSGGLVFPGVVKDIAQVDARSIPPHLSSEAGGETAAQRDPVTGQVRPQQQRYLAAIHLTEFNATLHPGVLARVQIEVEPQTLWWRFSRFLRATFR